MCLKLIFFSDPLVVYGKHHLLGVSTPWRSSLSPSCMALVFCSTLCSTSTGFSLMNKQKRKAGQPCFHPGAPFFNSTVGNQRRVFSLYSNFIQHCFIFRPSDSTESDDAAGSNTGCKICQSPILFILSREAIIHNYCSVPAPPSAAPSMASPVHRSNHTKVLSLHLLHLHNVHFVKKDTLQYSWAALFYPRYQFDISAGAPIVPIQR